jgi:hypothetical protein
MSRRRFAVLALAAAAVGGATAMAYAQVPPHQPGTVCLTPTFWCWARPPGRPGAVCYCPTPNGPVRGVFG